MHNIVHDRFGTGEVVLGSLQWQLGAPVRRKDLHLGQSGLQDED